MCVGSIATRASRGGAERLRGQRTVDRVSGDRLAHSTQSVSETTRDERSRRGLRGAHATCGSRGVCTWHGTAVRGPRTAIRSVFAVRVRCLWGTRPVVSVFESVRPSSTSSAAGDALYAPPPASCETKTHAYNARASASRGRSHTARNFSRVAEAFQISTLAIRSPSHQRQRHTQHTPRNADALGLVWRLALGLAGRGATRCAQGPACATRARPEGRNTGTASRNRKAQRAPQNSAFLILAKISSTYNEGCAHVAGPRGRGPRRLVTSEGASVGAARPPLRPWVWSRGRATS